MFNFLTRTLNLEFNKKDKTCNSDFDPINSSKVKIIVILNHFSFFEFCFKVFIQLRRENVSIKKREIILPLQMVKKYSKINPNEKMIETYC